MNYIKGTFNIVSPNAPYGIERNIRQVEGYKVETTPNLPNLIIHRDITTSTAQNFMAAEHLTGANIAIGYHAETKEAAAGLAIEVLVNPHTAPPFDKNTVKDLAAIKHKATIQNSRYVVRNAPGTAKEN